jgi:hypothetical protein
MFTAEMNGDERREMKSKSEAGDTCEVALLVVGASSGFGDTVSDRRLACCCHSVWALSGLVTGSRGIGWPCTPVPGSGPGMRPARALPVIRAEHDQHDQHDQQRTSSRARCHHVQSRDRAAAASEGNVSSQR